jgi:hypothetical protein
MRDNDEWRLDDSHPDAVEHREFLAQEKKKGAAVAAPAPRTATRAWVDKQLLQTCESVGKFISEEVSGPLLERIKALEERSAAADYKGIWEPGRSYKKNESSTYAGSLWVCRKDYTEGHPGEKRGQRGRDAKKEIAK